eukprot:2994304-Prymnesium_polylepis.1
MLSVSEVSAPYAGRALGRSSSTHRPVLHRSQWDARGISRRCGRGRKQERLGDGGRRGPAADSYASMCESRSAAERKTGSLVKSAANSRCTWPSFSSLSSTRYLRRNG